MLVYTGFALKYPEGWWAVPLLSWEAHSGCAGFMHRGAALALMGSLLWHLLNSVASQALRTKLRGLDVQAQGYQ